MTTTSSKTWLSIPDLADRYGVSVKTVRTWRRTGVTPTGYKIGRHVRFLLDDVERWERERAEAVGPDAA